MPRPAYLRYVRPSLLTTQGRRRLLLALSAVLVAFGGNRCAVWMRPAPAKPAASAPARGILVRVAAGPSRVG